MLALRNTNGMQYPAPVESKLNADWDHFDWLQALFGFQVKLPSFSVVSTTIVKHSLRHIDWKMLHKRHQILLMLCDSKSTCQCLFGTRLTLSPPSCPAD